MEPSPVWIIALRFDTIERNGAEQPIALKPLDDGDRSNPRIQVARGGMDRPEGAGVFVFAAHGNIVLDQRFRSEWETR
jgi:hypothetical protein